MTLFRRSCVRGIALLGMVFALNAGVAWGFAGNYHEFLAWYWWQKHCPGKAPDMENGGIFFILASSGTDIRGTTLGIVVMKTFPKEWNKINWRYFHRPSATGEYIEELFGAETKQASFSGLLDKITAEALVTRLPMGKVLAEAAIDERQKWIARGWAFHNLCDYISVSFEMTEKDGMRSRFYPDAVILHRPRPGVTKRKLDALSDALSSMWLGLDDVDMKLRKKIDSLLASRQGGGEIIGNFAFVLQRAYDKCGADPVGFDSTFERARNVMVPIVDEFARGVSVQVPGFRNRIGWGVSAGSRERMEYAREVVIPRLFGKLKSN